MSKMNRRDFLKVIGVSGAATTAGCNYVDPRLPYENILPYVVVPDQILPGVASWFATACNECSAGCGVLARNREGRIVKLEGNPDHPTNKGKLCSRGQAGLQAAYSPDRFEGPQMGGKAVDWDTATKTAVDAISAARASGKTIAWVGQYRGGSLGALIGQFMGALGGRELHWEPLGVEHLLSAASQVFGRTGMPSYVLDEARTIVSFGAEFLSTWGSPIAQTLGYANSRGANRGDAVSRLVCVEPRVGNTSAMADLHLAALPGTEVGVALALTRLLAEKVGYAGPAAALIATIDVDALLSASGLGRDKLEEVATWMSQGPSAVFPGGSATSAEPGALAVAALLLNEVAGNIGRTVVFGPEPKLGSISSFRDVSTLIGDCAAGKVGVLFLDGVDLAHVMPADLNIATALKAVGQVIAFSNEPMDSLVDNTLVLPPGSSLETWGDNEAVAGRHALQQPGMKPLKDTRSIGDSLLALAGALNLVPPPSPPLLFVVGIKGDLDPAASAVPNLPGLEQKSFHAYLQARWEAVVWPLAGSPGTFASFWTECLQRGGFFQDAAVEAATFSLAALPNAAAATPAGSDPILAVFPHLHLHDGRHANRPWAQEVPEPLSTFSWGTWVEIHPDAAAELGLGKDDAVVVETSHGSIEVAWFGSPGIRRDTVALVLGNGHDNAGRYARYGSNPMKLLSSKVDEASGALALVSTRASIRRANNPSPCGAAAGSLTQEGRGINYTVYAGSLGESTGPGTLVHQELPHLDDRLQKAGITDMFPEPEHPTYRFAMAVDLNRCTGCGACQTACYAENNLPVVGPDQVNKGRSMGWIRLSRYWEGEGEHPDVRFQPVMCQQCSHAPCEGVCPVLATYHNLDGLNAMIYNRCVGTRYCANNCPYTARRFNYHTFAWPEPFHLMLNPDVSVREMGVMEKCTFCVQRLREAKDAWRDQAHATVPDAALQKLPACVQACPADAMVFGNLKDPESKVSKAFQDGRAYAMLAQQNTMPGVRYLARISHVEPAAEVAGGEHH